MPIVIIFILLIISFDFDLCFFRFVRMQILDSRVIFEAEYQIQWHHYLSNSIMSKLVPELEVIPVIEWEGFCQELEDRLVYPIWDFHNYAMVGSQPP